MGATEPLRAHHSLRSEQKREAVLAAARAIIRCGRPIEWVALAERAGVSEKFIHDPKHADIKAQVKEMIAVNSGQQAERQAATDQVTIASLRVELLNLRAHLKRKDAQLAMLERKLSHHAGQQLEAELPRQPGSMLEQADRAAQRALELEGRVRELETQLDERDREVLALPARELDREDRAHQFWGLIDQRGHRVQPGEHSRRAAPDHPRPQHRAVNAAAAAVIDQHMSNGTPTGLAQRQTVLDGVLERITYANEQTGYTIARVATERTGAELLTVVGSLLGAQVGESLRLTGRWATHPKYGRQFQADSYTTMLPATIQGIRRYLGSGLIKGIGPMMAERMVAHFGTEILTVIDQQPVRLREVHGLGPRRTQRIADAWEEQKAIKDVMVFLSDVGVSTSLAVRIYKRYGDASIQIVRAEPYRLASEVWGICFRTADALAQALGIPHDSPQRIKAGLQYTLSQAADNGHCYLPEPELIREAATVLDVDPQLIDPCLEELAVEEGVVREPVPARDPAGGEPVTAVYLVAFHRAERSLARGLLDLLQTGRERLPAFVGVDWAKACGWLRARTGQDLADGQQHAVELALTSKVAVLTGGPGCGKSFTVRSIIELATAKKATVLLVAPTGRAAKRLTELTGQEALTVHRLLELQPGGEPRYDRDNPLAADLVVVDECSMMDVILANKLIKAIPEGAHLLLVGDVDQLPSVGAGEVLRDLLASDSVPRVRLTQIFRQAQHSGIVVNAHRINHGRPPQVTGFSDFYWFTCDPAKDSGVHPAEQTAELVVDIVARRIPARFGLDPRRDIQVLAPMHRGPAGAGNLNALLQAALTPEQDATPEKRYGGRVFRVGDKVTQLRNNYTKGGAGVFNGTLGVITSLSLPEQTVTVLTDENEQIDYDFAELDELAHAYAITIHRSQGSEYPAVVIPLTTAAWMMLQRNLLYTAITRAKRLIVLIGSRRALAQAVRTPGAGRRHTALTHRLGPAPAHAGRRR